MLDVKLGKEFQTLKDFKVFFEGDFGSVELTESSLLELQKITLPRVETLQMTVSIFTAESQNESKTQEQPSVPVLFGLKHFELSFSKEPTHLKVHCGPHLSQVFSLTLRLYG